MRTPDPAGGLPWGMRVTTTTRGLGCLEAAREQNHQLGVVGQDNAFHDDGLFHPLSAALSATSPVCSPLDRQQRLILSVRLSGTCLPPGSTQAI